MTKLFLLITVISFLLHLIWEYAQCIPLFIHGELKPTHLSMIIATIGDVGLTWIAFLFISIISKDFYWIIIRWRKKQWGALIFIALALSVIIEIRALKNNRWTYTEINPLLFESISVVPILQLLLLFPLTFYIAKKIKTKYSQILS